MKSYVSSCEPKPFTRLSSILSRNPATVILVVDLETNGLSSRYSVLSVTAEKYRYHGGTLERMGRFHRFYHAREPENPDAIRVNGLTRERLQSEREGKGWPPFFDEDEEFREFCQGAHLLVGHNVQFDLKFMPFLRGIEWFCTMRSHTTGKYPSLEALALRYGITVQRERLHQGDYDVELTVEIFQKILEDLEVYVWLESDRRGEVDEARGPLQSGNVFSERLLRVRGRLNLQKT